MNHAISHADRDFRKQLESCEFPLSDFSHRAHLRLAYVYLVENGTEKSVGLMQAAIHRLLAYNSLEPAQKYHETITRAWIFAMHHFMSSTVAANSADELIDRNPQMLDSRIMLSHYSPEVLFSDQARQSFLPPDREPIPRHEI